MKFLTMLFIYTASFMLVFFTLSLIGLLWTSSYSTIISDDEWFAVYAVFIGSWVSVFPAREYYMKHEAYFDEVF